MSGKSSAVIGFFNDALLLTMTGTKGSEYSEGGRGFRLFVPNVQVCVCFWERGGNKELWCAAHHKS